jgi:hypothetical protein
MLFIKLIKNIQKSRNRPIKLGDQQLSCHFNSGTSRDLPIARCAARERDKQRLGSISRRMRLFFTSIFLRR